jgi:hypothetical protein
MTDIPWHPQTGGTSTSASAPTISLAVPTSIEKEGQQGVGKVILNAYTYTNSKAPLARDQAEDHKRQEDPVTEPIVPLKDKKNEQKEEETDAIRLPQ